MWFLPVCVRAPARAFLVSTHMLSQILLLFSSALSDPFKSFERNHKLAHMYGKQALQASLATMDQQSACRLFMLPAELRITIYQLAFATTTTPSRLASAYIHAPQQNLLLTCKQMYHDAAQIFARACRTYYSKSTFIVVHDHVTYDWAHLLDLIGEANIEHMSKVAIVPRPTLPMRPSLRRKLVLENANNDALGWIIEVGGIRIGSGPPLGIGMPTRVADQVAEIPWKHHHHQGGKAGLKRKLLQAVLKETCRV